MRTIKDRPCLRGAWAVPTAYVAMVAVTTAVILLEIVLLATAMGASMDPMLMEIWDRVLPAVLPPVLAGVTVVGLPAWTILYLFGAVHPGLGALVGAALTAVAAVIVASLILPGLPVVVFVLFGLLPGAAGGAVCLWVAYRR